MYSGSYSAEDISLIIGSGVTVESVDTYWKTFPDQDLSTAIGNVVGLKNGLGQERTEGYAPVEGAVIGGSVVDDSVTVTSEEKLPEEDPATL